MKVTASYSVILVSSLVLGFSNPLRAVEPASFDGVYNALYGELAAASTNAEQPIALKAFTIAAETIGFRFQEQQATNLYFSLVKRAREFGPEKEIGRRVYHILLNAREHAVPPTGTESVGTTKPDFSSSSRDLQRTEESNAPTSKPAGKPSGEGNKPQNGQTQDGSRTNSPSESPLQYTILNVTGGTTNQIIVHSFVSGAKTNAFGTVTIQNFRNGQSNGTPVATQLTNRTETVIPNQIALTPVTNYSTFFHFGAFVLNPYTIGDDHMIQEAGVKASAFLELVYNNRWAWDSERFQAAETNQEWLLLKPLRGYDFQGRLSYTFTSGDNPSASTIVGSGDVAAEFTVAKHLWRQHSDYAAQSINLELSYGAVSDRNVFDVHHRGFVGLGYVGSMPERILDNGRNVQYAIRFGGANVEHVNFVNDSTREVVFKNGVPDFAHEWGLALESEAYFPILEQSFLTVGGRLYGNSGPNVWSMWIGFTTPLGKIGSLIPK